MHRVTRTHYPLIEKMRPTGPDRPQTAAFLNRQYAQFERQHPYPESRNLSTWRLWRRRLRRALRRTLCLDQLGQVPIPRPTYLETVEKDGYMRHKIAYETLADNWVSAYLLVPQGEGNKKGAVICPHGHVPGAKEGVVNPANAPGAAYGHEFARRGLVVLAPDNAGMGERDLDAREIVQASGCQLTWNRLNHMGLDLTGLRVFDLLAGLELLLARPDVDRRRLGCAGLSGGCWLSQVLTALDRRIKAVVLSGFFTTFAQTSWHGHCICHHPFGIGKICDMPDLSALIAPRPQFVESGKEDHPYPPEPALSMVRRAYELLGASGHLGVDLYQGGHMFHGEVSIPWMLRQLE